MYLLTLEMILGPQQVQWNTSNVSDRGCALSKLFEALIRRYLALTKEMTDDQVIDLVDQEGARANLEEYPDLFGKADAGNVIVLKPE